MNTRKPPQPGTLRPRHDVSYARAAFTRGEALQQIIDSKSHEEAIVRAKVALGQLGVGALLTYEPRVAREEVDNGFAGSWKPSA